MSFHIHISDADRSYLEDLPLSSEARRRLDQFISEFLAKVGDDFRLNPENRLHPDGPYFFAQFIILDIWGDRRLHTIDFHVRDDRAAVGVLLIVFIDHH